MIQISTILIMLCTVSLKLIKKYKQLGTPELKNKILARIRRFKALPVPPVHPDYFKVFTNCN